MSTHCWPTGWDNLFAPTDEKTAELLVVECGHRREIALGNFHKWAAAHTPRDVRRMIRRYLQSDSLKVASLAIAWGKRRHSKQSALKLVRVGLSLNPWRGTSDPVQLKAVEKSNGEGRRVGTFGRRDHALQLLCRDCCGVAIKQHPRLFSFGSGLGSLKQWLEDELPSTTFILTTDIPSCFGHAVHSAIKLGLPLPGRVIEAVLIGPMERQELLPPGKSGLYLNPGATMASSPGRGIPPGSALSAFASDQLISSLLCEVEAAVPGVIAGAWSDNLIFLAQKGTSEASLTVALRNAVIARFGESVVDELARRTTITSPADLSRFCGRYYQWANGRLIVSIPEDRLDRFLASIVVGIGDALDRDPESAALKVRQRILGWASQNWDVRGVVPTVFKAIEHWCEMFSDTGPKVKAPVLPPAELIPPTKRKD